ncbi:Pirin domain protein [Burkholderia sp. lig30]|jgi:redox-sensitive bicupin YhaK (pirin superfamily)|uniref:pirin family protein n=1 Tax=Burkholderia sp. lig30 TaxID=1192124 RepID=UPI00046143B9|nr:pirin family protein [Burkholderia sp. lig30]KDB08964.1 Pirin domain protein [Burkholderia sp. lig30]
MAVHVSSLTHNQMSPRGTNFAAARIDLRELEGFINPVVGLDHFRMRGPTFSPHPHAGFSAISYLFEDSAGAMRNRDSLGHDFVAAPGDVIWTQAGCGVVHDEFPAENGREVHGIQRFVNLSAANKQLNPKVFWVKRDDIPVAGDDSANRVRVVVGDYDGIYSPLMPAEPFQLLDGTWNVPGQLPLRGNWNTILYVLEGMLQVDAAGKQIALRRGDAVGLRSDAPALLHLMPQASTRMLVLAGPALTEPLVMHGPFIMNSVGQLADAVARFNAGEMGRLQPVGAAQ